MLDTDIEHRSEEVLEIAWKLTQEQGLDGVPMQRLGLGAEDPALQELTGLGLVVLATDRLFLTEKGKPEAENTVRRHRLAERLMSDVLDLKGAQAEDSACRFEHLLHEGIEEKICTLLGHPVRCPHGQPIPPGKCCREGRASDLRLVATVAELKIGQKGSIAYLHSHDRSRIQKLMAMGVCPGASLHLIQRRPSFVFQIGRSQFAVDEELARSIYIRL